MKVLMLNYEFPPLGGGAANANKYILEQLSEKDVDIDLVTSSKDRYSEEKFAESIDIYRVEVGKEEMHHWTQLEIIRYMWKGLLKSFELKRKNNYDVVHAWFGFPCGLMAKMLRIPYIVSLRGSDVPGYNERFSTQYIVLRPIVRSVWRSAEKVIPNSKSLRDLAKETLEIEMKVIPNGVDSTKFTPDYNISKPIEVITVSRLTERKRIQDIIEAVKNLDVNLKIIGDGVKKKSLEKLSKDLRIEDKCDFLGRVKHTKLPEYYKSADIFVLPSRKEGMSNTILEAISSGLPVIITDTGDGAKLAEGNGFIVEKENPDEIRQAIKKYIEEPGLIEEHGRISREKAQDMNWKTISSRYLDIYQEIKSEN